MVASKGPEKKETPTGQDAKVSQPVCDSFAANSFKPLFCANCFNAKADHGGLLIFF